MLDRVIPVIILAVREESQTHIPQNLQIIQERFLHLDGPSRGLLRPSFPFPIKNRNQKSDLVIALDGLDYEHAQDLDSLD